MVDSFMVSGRLPNIHFEVINKNNLETSIIYYAPFVAGFLGLILIFLTSKNAPFLASFFGSITYNLIRKNPNLFPFACC